MVSSLTRKEYYLLLPDRGLRAHSKVRYIALGSLLSLMFARRLDVRQRPALLLPLIRDKNEKALQTFPQKDSAVRISGVASLINSITI